ncbi:MAG: thioredoxin domain-containing protein [Cyclobacteriaceae bacterium]|nr:thioredoxin domain-containing protein [Cyclobacteriaceae bacterium]
MQFPKFSFILLTAITYLSLTTSSCQNKKEEDMREFTNKLIEESSPYLLQHAHNPVNWYPWGDEALELAKKEQKLIIVSVGYAACHWCHVMEHESFEDTVVANLMNKHFISIKVDREERPDIDQVYMDAAQIMTGQGGWPLNVICLPDGRPIYAGTYFTKNNWMQVLEHVQDFYEKNPEKAIEQANKVQSGVAQMSIINVAEAEEFNQKHLDKAANDWINSIDAKKGGRRGKVKFPMPISLNALLNYATFYENKKGKEAVLTTLNYMAYGGIYDQIGGGFARYSTDSDWHIPHFEKMLYDNGQLLSAYSNAYKLTKNLLYKQVIRETIAFCNRELYDGKAAYYSSLDADSEGEEGKYYVWSKAEIIEVIGQGQEAYLKFYDVSDQGNWEGKNVFRTLVTMEEFCIENKLDLAEFKKQVKHNNKLLLKVREKRIHPGLDDKTLTSWNALMVAGLADAYEALGEEYYRKDALRTGNFLWSIMWDGGRLKRNYKNGRSSINGFSEDYAATIQAFIKLYQITFNEEWLIRADKLMEVSFKNFYNHDNGLFNFKSSEDSNLYVQKSNIDDNVIPSANSIMALNLYYLGHYLYNEGYLKQSKNMLASALPYMEQQASFYYNWFELYRRMLKEPYEVAIVGNNSEGIRKQLATHYMPNTLLLGGKTEGSLELLSMKLVKGKTMIYVCQNKTCKLPVEDVANALNQIK